MRIVINGKGKKRKVKELYSNTDSILITLIAGIFFISLAVNLINQI